MTQSTVAPLGGPALQSVLDLARTRYADDLTVSDLADQAGYSPFHFSRMFTAAMRIAPGQYLTTLRIDAAKRMLLTGSDPVIDIATASGFDSLSSFSRRFRASVGVPPAALRALAERVADRAPRPFRLVDERQRSLRVRSCLADPPGHTVSIWLGWFSIPAPIGVPAGGVLAEFGDVVDLPLAPGAPWLLGFAVAQGADPFDQLAPERPLVAVHPAPITAPGEVVLHFAHPDQNSSVPLLTALPSLYPGH